MGLSCNCDYDYEYKAGEWYYWYGDFNKTLFVPFTGPRRKRCCSCGQLINIGDMCNIFPRYRYPYNDIESRIRTGTDLDNALCDEATIRIANHYHCKSCAEIWLNLTDAGYECLNPRESMKDLLFILRAR